jgi:hypothetical protein
VAAASPHKTPIIPIPADAPPQNFRHQRYGSLTSQWEYRLAGGELAGYACRFDCYNAAGEPDKVVLPITYRDLGNGERAWRSKGLPAPRPLFRLPDIVGRPEALVLVWEGEKAAIAGAVLFPDRICRPTGLLALGARSAPEAAVAETKRRIHAGEKPTAAEIKREIEDAKCQAKRAAG